MEMLKVRRCNQVITSINQQIIDLAALLGIGTDYIYSTGQYVYLEFLSTSTIQMVISSQPAAYKNDVVISLEIFTEILIDVAAGILINDAMLKHNILVSS